MAYTLTKNTDGIIGSETSINRGVEERKLNVKFFHSHNFTTELGATATDVNTLIEGQNVNNTAVKVAPWRTGVYIFNKHASQVIYAGHSSTVSSTVGEFVIQPGGYLFLPLHARCTLYICGSGASTSCAITEVG